MRSVIIVGTQACGKTRNAQALARHYGLSNIHDDGRLPKPLPKEGWLFLVNEEDISVSNLPNVRIVPFIQAMQDAGLLTMRAVR